jgi:hypothetical protein
MRWLLLAGSAAVVATLWLPGQAAQPAPRPTADDPITFAQYRDWRNDFIARRRGEIADQLATGGLTAERKARLQQTKAYYDGLAALPAADRNRLFRQRFDQIDTDHDGTMDRAERTAWHDKRRALYRNTPGARQPAGAAATQ